MSETKVASDLWSRWLLERWHGGNIPYKALLRRKLEHFRDRVLDNAQLSAGMTLVDVGAGDGLIGFGAIDRIGPSLRVIFTDLSAPLLQHVKQLANERGVQSQCDFVLGSSEKLNGISDATVDVVATRASLAYVTDKRASLREFHRVLKPGGRISLCEPILQDDAFAVRALAQLIETQPTHPQIKFLSLLYRYRSAQYPSTEQAIWANPLTNFSERDLVHLVGEAGFDNVHLELHIDYKPADVLPWEVQLEIAPHPWAPTLREILNTKFSAEERMLFERGFRPMIESGKSVVHDAMAYITAQKAN
jgi:ubiquinone/menaquinone biosynthesis C-methylase UbiE